MSVVKAEEPIYQGKHHDYGPGDIVEFNFFNWDFNELNGTTAIIISDAVTEEYKGTRLLDGHNVKAWNVYSSAAEEAFDVWEFDLAPSAVVRCN